MPKNRQTTGEVLDPCSLSVKREAQRQPTVGGKPDGNFFPFLNGSFLPSGCIEALTMQDTISGRLKTLLRLLAPFSLLLQWEVSTVASAQTQAPKQHFACNVGYTPHDCQVAITVLRNALAQYPVHAVGEWTWVLVRSEDWKQLLSNGGFDSNNPAFSYLPKRETFFDGSLVVKESTRGMELSVEWHMPIEDLLDLAIRHELAHALCNERDEIKINRAAVALKNGTPLSCRASLAATKRAPPNSFESTQLHDQTQDRHRPHSRYCARRIFPTNVGVAGRGDDWEIPSTPRRRDYGTSLESCDETSLSRKKKENQK